MHVRLAEKSSVKVKRRIRITSLSMWEDAVSRIRMEFSVMIVTMRDKPQSTRPILPNKKPMF
jgi:hypothetical protein